MVKKKYGMWMEIIYGIVLVAFTIYMLLDTFVLSEKVTVVDSAQTASISQNTTGNNTKTSTTYEDDNIEVTLTDYRENDTDIHVADVTVSSAAYLKTAFAQSAYGKNVTEKTSEIAENVNAILAINGDYYGAQERGYVIRNGVLYRSTAKSGNEDLVIYADGSFEIVSEDDITAEELLENGAQNVLAFGPALVENGSVSVTEGEEVGKAMASRPHTTWMVEVPLQCILTERL